jgi:MoaA/NifB/PqqE/SkfB family radical SAM enzyme
VTNECNLACLHCIEESGPGKAFPDELTDEQVFNFLEQAMDLEIPYLSFSGGEPMVHPRFFEMVEYVCARNGQLKIETNGAYLSPENCARLKSLGVKAVQVSLDGATRETFNRMRVRGDFDRTVEGVRHLRAAGVPIEINYSPTSFNAHEIGAAVDLAADLGAYSFYTGRTMYTGNAVKTWHRLAPSEAQYKEYFEALHRKTEEYRGRMRVHFHEMGLLEELRYRLHHPAALLIVLPNGLVKLINALPFVCGDLRRQSLGEIWARFQSAWADPRVASFVEDLAEDPRKTATLHQWVYL